MSRPAEAVFCRDGQFFVPGELARGPWSAEAQHGGAPAALLTGLAEAEVNDPEMSLCRLTMELIRPVPIAPLTVELSMGRGRSVRRVELQLFHGDVVVAKAVALFLRHQPVSASVTSTDLPFHRPEKCHESFRVPGMEAMRSFHYTAMEIRVARGSTREPGPATGWFRFAAPLLEGFETTPAMRATAPADFGNGLSWTLPIEDFTFVNTDLTVYLHRPPAGEWVAVDSEMTVEPTGIGLVRTRLFDQQGPVGIAQQNLFIRER